MKFFRKFGSHYSIERFGVMFLSLSMCMIILLTSIFIRKIEHDKDVLSGMAIYTNAFSFSRTQTEGSVRGVYVSEDKTKCMLLLRVSDMGDIPIDANEYEMFLTGSSSNQVQQSLKCTPTGMFYMFGSTGYMGVYLHSASGFPSQIMSLTIRSTNNFGIKNTIADSVKDLASTDASFAQYNQARIYFNPGGAYATHGEFLDEKEWTVLDAYSEMVAEPYEQTIRNNLQLDMMEMMSQRLIMNEYTERLKKQGMAEPSVPLEIANDKIVVTLPESEEPLMWNQKSDLWTDGEHSYQASETWYHYTTNQVVPGGYDFDWRNGSVRKGYLKNLTGSEKMSDWTNFFTEHESQQKSKSLTIDDTWYYADGSAFVSGSSGDGLSNSQKEAIQGNIDKLVSAWTAFYKAKSSYQLTHLSELLRIESDIANVMDTYTVNTNEKGRMLTLY